MADCECLPGCPFFNDKMGDMPSTANLMKKTYCQGNWSTCARHIVFEKLGRDAVPNTLYPNMKDKAMEILTKSA